MLALLLVCASLLLTVLGMPELFVAAPETEPEPIELAATPEPTPEPTQTPEPTPQLRERWYGNIWTSCCPRTGRRSFSSSTTTVTSGST